MKNLVTLAFSAIAGVVLAVDSASVTTSPVKADDDAIVVDGIAAKVNGEAITVGEVLFEIRRDPMHMPAGGDMRRAYRDTLDNLIDRKLILRDAEQKKMQMQDWVVDNRVREIVKDHFDSDINKLQSVLADAHIPYDDWKRNIREDLIIQAMQYQTITRNVTASPSAMRTEYAVHADRYAAGKLFDVSVILLGPSGGKSAMDRAADVVQRLEAGEDFAAVAREVSSDPHSKDGGVWKGVDPKETFKPEVAEALEDIKVGDRTAPIEMKGWVSIVRKDAVFGGSKRTFAEAYDDVMATVKINEARRLHAEWMKRLRDNAHIVVYEFSTMK